MAKKEAENFPALSGLEEPSKSPVFARCPAQNRAYRSSDRIKMKTIGREAVQINRESIDLRYVEQLTDSEQVTALGYCVRYAEKHFFGGRTTIQEVVRKLEEKIEQDGLSVLCESTSSVACLAMPREQEIFACFNRYRGLVL